jgi:hypothetical protein
VVEEPLGSAGCEEAEATAGETDAATGTGGGTGAGATSAGDALPDGEGTQMGSSAGTTAGMPPGQATSSGGCGCHTHGGAALFQLWGLCLAACRRRRGQRIPRSFVPPRTGAMGAFAGAGGWRLACTRRRARQR